MSKTVSKFVINEVLEEKEGYLGMLLATLNARVFGNLLIGKRTVRARLGIIRPRKKSFKSRSKFLMHLHPLKVYEIQKKITMKKLKGFLKEIIFDKK